MTFSGKGRLRALLIWTFLVAAAAVPLAASTMSPLLAWREPIYIAAGFAGVTAMSLMLFQPLLAGGYLPGLAGLRGRRAHRVMGATLVALVLVHIAGLWISSPPDVIDVLLLASPTPFSIWGVLAMWALFASAALAMLRKRIRLRVWRIAHTMLAAVIVVGTILHAALIEGTMEPLSKLVLGALIAAATLKTVADLRGWATKSRRKA